LNNIADSKDLGTKVH